MPELPRRAFVSFQQTVICFRKAVAWELFPRMLHLRERENDVLGATLITSSPELPACLEPRPVAKSRTTAHATDTCFSRGKAILKHCIQGPAGAHPSPAFLTSSLRDAQPVPTGGILDPGPAVLLFCPGHPRRARSAEARRPGAPKP